MGIQNHSTVLIWVMAIAFISKIHSASVIGNLSGLLRYYPGDNNLADATGSGNDLVVYGSSGSSAQYETVQTLPFSSPRGVFLLNGSSWNVYRLTASTDNLPMGNAPRTLMGWVRIDALSGPWTHIFAYGRSGCSAQTDFVIHSDKRLILDFGCSVEVGFETLVADYTPWFGVWKHYTFTYDGTNFISYIDGVLNNQGILTESHNQQPGTLDIGANFHGGSNPFYGAVAELAVFNRALSADEVAAAFNAAGGGGDPHFFAFGGISFTWQGECDVILIKSPKGADTETDIEMHARTQLIRKWSAISTIAMKIGQDVGVIESSTGKFLLNGIEVESIQSNTLTLKKSAKKKTVLYKLVIDKTKNIEIKANTRTNMIYTTLSGKYPQGTIGLLGSPHNPGLFARNGTIMTEKDVNIFSESWQVTDMEPKLFHQTREPQFPSKCLYKMTDKMKKENAKSRSRHLKEVHTISRNDAAIACANHPPGPFRNFCIEDVMSTGDLDVGQDAFYD